MSSPYIAHSLSVTVLGSFLALPVVFSHLDLVHVLSYVRFHDLHLITFVIMSGVFVMPKGIYT